MSESESSRSSVNESQSLIDWSAIRLPSDETTLGELRRSVDRNPLELEVLLHNLDSLEFEVVSHALSSPKQGSTKGRVLEILHEEKSRELAALYNRIGLAAGPNEAAQLVEQLSSRAAATRKTRGSLDLS